MNFRPIAMRSSSGTSFHVFCASTAREIFASSSLSLGYVRVTHGCWLCGLMVVWITEAEDIVVRGKIAIALHLRFRTGSYLDPHMGRAST